MEWNGPFIRLKLDTDEPVEIGEFVASFTAIASEYDRFVRQTKPDTDPNATLFVKEVRAGCIEAELIPWITGFGAASAAAVVVMQNLNTVGEFVERYGKVLTSYKMPGGKAPEATLSQLRDFGDQVAAIASTPGSSLQVAAIEVKKGKEEVRAVFQFDTADAQKIRENVERHKVELEAVTNATHQRVLMVFRRSDADGAKLGKRSGELVRIESLSPKKLPLIYTSDLAEQRIKHEIAEADDSVYKKGFVVDVNVELRAGRLIAYRVTHVHQVIDLPDEDDD